MFKVPQDIKFYCCEIDCLKNAVFYVQEQGEGKNYEDYIHSCSDHLSEFILDGVFYTVCKLYSL